MSCDCTARLEAIETRLAKLEAKRKSASTGTDWLADLKANPLFAHVDFAAEERKIAIWKLQPKNVNRQITKRFWLNWLAKVDSAVPVQAVKPSVPKAQVKIDTPPRHDYSDPPEEVMTMLRRIGQGM